MAALTLSDMFPCFLCIESPGGCASGTEWAECGTGAKPAKEEVVALAAVSTEVPGIVLVAIGLAISLQQTFGCSSSR